MAWALGFVPANYEYVPPGRWAAVGYQKILLPALCRMQSGLFDKCERVGIVPLKMTFMPRQLGFYYSEPPLNNRPQQRRRGGGAVRRSKCRAGKKTSKGPPEALWFMEAHRKRFKFEERWGYCHLFMRTSQPIIMGCHDFCRRILILNCLTKRYDMLQCDGSDTMLYDRYYMMWYDTIR